MDYGTSKRHGQGKSVLRTAFFMKPGKVVASASDGLDGASFVVLRGSVSPCELDRWSVGGSR